MLDFVIWEVF